MKATEPIQKGRCVFIKSMLHILHRPELLCSSGLLPHSWHQEQKMIWNEEGIRKTLVHPRLAYQQPDCVFLVWRWTLWQNPPEAFPFDGRHHGNIRWFVCHGVPGGKLIIKSALWLDWSQDYKATGLILTWLSANGIDSSLEMRIQLIFFFLFFVSDIELAVCMWGSTRLNKKAKGKKKTKKKTADGASSSQLTTLTNWLGG